MAKRTKIHKVIGAKEMIGNSLKEKRISMGYSIADAAELTDFSKSTIINIEKGIATNLDYYIAYAQALNFKLDKLFDIEVEYKPRFELPENKKNRIFLSRKIKILFNEEDFFSNDVSVNDIITRLEEKKEVKRSKKLSTDVSRILLNWVEDGTIYIVEKKGRNNIYSKVES